MSVCPQTPQSNKKRLGKPSIGHAGPRLARPDLPYSTGIRTYASTSKALNDKNNRQSAHQSPPTAPRPAPMTAKHSAREIIVLIAAMKQLTNYYLTFPDFMVLSDRRLGQRISGCWEWTCSRTSVTILKGHRTVRRRVVHYRQSLMGRAEKGKRFGAGRVDPHGFCGPNPLAKMADDSLT